MAKQETIAHDTARIPSNGHSRPATLSSNATLFWRVFLPVFGTVFLTGLLLAFWLTPEDELYLPFPLLWLRIALTLVWGGWLLYVRRALWPLKRIDADDAHIYVTNYWTTIRYPWADVAQMSEAKNFGHKLVRMQLKAPGRFGQTIAFLPGSHYREWLEEHEKRYLLLAN